ncbi:UDP-N-acetylglucosamine 2-epimerase [hydrothermal vent metagenome]|uniref:UDP-N-acetylglucosamine 2-epimerase n=1 Tax=hydrothermal vent metagenome TaxID=652676 RepID=A0A1W1BBL5_9ZZZZ
MREICVVTGSRADYGLLYYLLKEISKDKDLKLQLIVTGMHLSEEFGFTYKIIEQKFKINKKIPMNLSNDSAEAISTEMAKAQITFAKTYKKIQPDLLVVLGDRYEILSATIPAVIANIPIAHIHGGETTQGAVDEVIRHSLTKMSHLHFCASETYKDRIVQLGENKKRVYNVGALGLDSIKNLKLLPKNKFERSINCKLLKRSLLITYHAQTLSVHTPKEQFTELLNALSKLKNTTLIFTKTNSDAGGKTINEMIDNYVKDNANAIAFTSLGQLRYLSALLHVDAVVGNSSSGLLEVPSFKKATIDIGERQKGRIKAKSVLSSACQADKIYQNIQKIYTKSFSKTLLNVKSPFGTAGASKKIKKIIKKVDLTKILDKKFHDIPL